MMTGLLTLGISVVIIGYYITVGIFSNWIAGKNETAGFFCWMFFAAAIPLSIGFGIHSVIG